MNIYPLKQTTAFRGKTCFLLLSYENPEKENSYFLILRIKDSDFILATTRTKQQILYEHENLEEEIEFNRTCFVDINGVQIDLEECDG